MTKIIKTLGIENSRLNVITAGRRIPIADFSGRIEIYEKQNNVSILGRHCKGEKKIYASFILCDNIEYCSDDEIHSGKVYESVGDVQGEQFCERFIFSGLRFEDSDPVNKTTTKTALTDALHLYLLTRFSNLKPQTSNSSHHRTYTYWYMCKYLFFFIQHKVGVKLPYTVSNML